MILATLLIAVQLSACPTLRGTEEACVPFANYIRYLRSGIAGQMPERGRGEVGKSGEARTEVTSERTYSNGTLPGQAAGHLSFTTRWDPPKVAPVLNVRIEGPKKSWPKPPPPQKARAEKKRRHARVRQTRHLPAKPPDATPSPGATPVSKKEFSPLRLPYIRK